MGQTAKLFLKFTTPFWHRDVHLYVRMPSHDEDPFKLIWNDFQAYGSRDNKMYYLCLTVTGEELTTFRKLHREKLLIDVALHAVADTVGSFMNLTDYKSAIFDTYAGHRVSWWTHDSDPYFRGSWSSSRPNCTTEDLVLLEKINDLTAGLKLFFAGEAFSRHYRGTLHGAMMSGKLAATEILTSRMEFLYDVQFTYNSTIGDITDTTFHKNIGIFVFDEDDDNCTELIEYMYLMVEQEQLNYVKLLDPPFLSEPKGKESSTLLETVLQVSGKYW